MITAPADLIHILFVLVLFTVALMLTQRNLSSLFSIYAVQSALLAAIATLLFAETGTIALLLMAVLTAATKVVAIPFMLRKVQKDIYTRRDLEFSYLSPISSIIICAALIFVVYRSLSDFLFDLSPDRQLFLGAVIGISLVLMGMLITFSRRQIVTKIVGYLVMENGVLLFSIFIAEMPFIIEVLILLDLVILTLLSAILAFGIDSTMKEFHRKLDPFNFWGRKQ